MIFKQQFIEHSLLFVSKIDKDFFDVHDDIYTMIIYNTNKIWIISEWFCHQIFVGHSLLFVSRIYELGYQFVNSQVHVKAYQKSVAPQLHRWWKIDSYNLQGGSFEIY